MMRIVFIADVHGSWQQLKGLLDTTQADLYLVTGDLLKSAFRSSDNFFRFSDLHRHFNYLKCRTRTEINTREFVEKRLRDREGDQEETGRAREYLRLHRLAERTMHRELDRLEGLLASFPEKTIRVLPGNYDLDLQKTALRERDLHRKVLTVQGVKIAGYGGARGPTPGIPEDLAVPYGEYPSGGGLHSEPRDFFCRERPHIVVLHMPPFGILDRLRDYGHLGSVGIRDYIDQFAPQVVLCGHMHESWGVVREGSTVAANPSNFGRVPDLNGKAHGGYFFDCILEDAAYRVGTLRQLDKGRVFDLADYPLDEDGTLRPLVLDLDRMRVLGREPGIDERNLKQIRDFRRVRDFFRTYETDAARQRIEDLRRVYRKLRTKGEDVAFDVLGSVNFGMSEDGSDVDLVLYRRCSCRHALPESSCTLPRALWTCFQDLETRYKVDVTDCVNLEKVEASIQAEDPECQALQRFVLYRFICRPINLRMIRKTENLLLSKPGLRKKVEYMLKDYFNMMVLSQSHILSFKKYETRLHVQGASLPEGVEKKLQAYLGLK
jgi:Icc-related predicted phosphoesterase